MLQAATRDPGIQGNVFRLTKPVFRSAIRSCLEWRLSALDTQAVSPR
jgi:hypothetical protein